MPRFNYKNMHVLHAHQDLLVLHDFEISNPFAGAYERPYLTVERLAPL